MDTSLRVSQGSSVTTSPGVLASAKNCLTSRVKNFSDGFSWHPLTTLSGNLRTFYGYFLDRSTPGKVVIVCVGAFALISVVKAVQYCRKPTLPKQTKLELPTPPSPKTTPSETTTSEQQQPESEVNPEPKTPLSPKSTQSNGLKTEEDEENIDNEGDERDIDNEGDEGDSEVQKEGGEGDEGTIANFSFDDPIEPKPDQNSNESTNTTTSTSSSSATETVMGIPLLFINSPSNTTNGSSPSQVKTSDSSTPETLSSLQVSEPEQEVPGATEFHFEPDPAGADLTEPLMVRVAGPSPEKRKPETETEAKV